MSKPTQRDLVLQALMAAGSRGVHTFELRQQFISNPSQRVGELERDGHVITHTHERLHGRAWGVRYKLAAGSGTNTMAAGDRARHAPRDTRAEDTPSPTGDRLFDPTLGSSPAGAYDDLDAAA